MLLGSLFTPGDDFKVLPVWKEESTVLYTICVWLERFDCGKTTEFLCT
jgi:hypothetical protein